ncbi:MAG: hypothetical protein KAH86_02285 [Methanosarcinales archaeon]|nr:hypothetical protein [Methanosarcinales archaeon]
MEIDIKNRETCDEKGDFIKLTRPPGRPPTHIFPSIIYWVCVIVGTIIATIATNLMLLMAVIGGIGGYHIGNSFEMVIIGTLLGAVIGFFLFEGR